MKAVSETKLQPFCIFISLITSCRQCGQGTLKMLFRRSEKVLPAHFYSTTVMENGFSYLKKKCRFRHIFVILWGMTGSFCKNAESLITMYCEMILKKTCLSEFYYITPGDFRKCPGRSGAGGRPCRSGSPLSCLFLLRGMNKRYSPNQAAIIYPH